MYKVYKEGIREPTFCFPPTDIYVIKILFWMEMVDLDFWCPYSRQIDYTLIKLLKVFENDDQDQILQGSFQEKSLANPT